MAALYKYYVYSDFELCFQGQMEVCEILGLFLQVFFFLHPRANEMFQKKLRLFPMAVEVCGGKVGYWLSHSGCNTCNRVRVGVGDWGERQ